MCKQVWLWVVIAWFGADASGWADPPAPVVDSDVAPQRLDNEPARPAVHPVRKIIEQMIPKATQEERDIWFEQMRDLPPGVVADMLNFRKQANASAPLSNQPQVLLPKTVATDELPAITRSTLERSIRVHRTNLLLTAVTGSRRQIPLMSATAAGEEIELEWLGSRLDITPGIFQITQRPLDLAINGAGWFVVTLEDERLYTRDGSFSLDPEGRLGLLTPRGFAPLVPSIVVSDATQRIEVQTNGSVYVTENADVESKVVGQVEVVSFLDDTALRLHASGCYRATAEAGRPTQLLSQGSKGSAVQVRSGMLERTNVNVEAEMLAIERLAAGLKRD